MTYFTESIQGSIVSFVKSTFDTMKDPGLHGFLRGIIREMELEPHGESLYNEYGPSLWENRKRIKDRDATVFTDGSVVLLGHMNFRYLWPRLAAKSPKSCNRLWEYLDMVQHHMQMRRSMGDRAQGMDGFARGIIEKMVANGESIDQTQSIASSIQLAAKYMMGDEMKNLSSIIAPNGKVDDPETMAFVLKALNTVGMDPTLLESNEEKRKELEKSLRSYGIGIDGEKIEDSDDHQHGAEKIEEEKCEQTTSDVHGDANNKENGGQDLNKECEKTPDLQDMMPYIQKMMSGMMDRSRHSDSTPPPMVDGAAESLPSDAFNELMRGISTMMAASPSPPHAGNMNVKVEEVE